MPIFESAPGSIKVFQPGLTKMLNPLLFFLNVRSKVLQFLDGHRGVTRLVGDPARPTCPRAVGSVSIGRRISDLKSAAASDRKHTAFATSTALSEASARPPCRGDARAASDACAGRARAASRCPAAASRCTLRSGTV